MDRRGKRTIAQIAAALACLLALVCLCAGCATTTDGSEGSAGSAAAFPSEPPIGADAVAAVNDSAITAFAQKYDSDAPVKLVITENSANGAKTYEFTDAATIQRVFQRLSALTVSGAGEASNGPDEFISFVMADGTQHTFTFQQHALAVDGGRILYAMDDTSNLWVSVATLENASGDNDNP